MAATLTKECTFCHEEKTVDLFHLHQAGQFGRRAECANCCNQRIRAIRWKHLGITPEQVKTIYEAQKGLCAICVEPPKDKRGLLLDHDHLTGAIRGGLCHPCNVAIGLMQDDPERLSAAARYLEG